MKGPFSIWAFFGLTLWIDIISHLIFWKKDKRVDPYSPIRDVSVIIPVHKEPASYIKETINELYKDRYPLYSVIICGDSESAEAEEIILKMSNIFSNLYYYKCLNKSKAKKINSAVRSLPDLVGEFVYIRDCRVKGEIDCIEKMVSYFNENDVAAVTSYGRVSIPKNALSRAYHYGKAWINEIGRFRKNAQDKRKAVFVICGASTMFRAQILMQIPIPSGSKTEDTYYTWVLQRKGYKIRVADDAIVSAPEVDGPSLEGIKSQLKQSFRWSCGAIQCLYREGTDIFKNKNLAYTTIIPGFVEAVMYTIPLVLIPFLFFISPKYALGFFIGDSFFSLLGTLIIIPKKFLKTIIHYPEIILFKYLNALVFITALFKVSSEAITDKTYKWTNEWVPPKTFISDI